MEFMEHIPQADPSATTPYEDPIDLARRIFGSSLRIHRVLSKYSVIDKELTKAQKQRIENMCPASFHGQERPLLLRFGLLITDKAIYHKPGPGKHSIRIAHHDVLMVHTAAGNGTFRFELHTEAVSVDSTKRDIPHMESPRGTLFFLEQLQTNATGERAFMTLEFQKEYQNSSHARDMLGQMKNGESPDTIVGTMIDTHHQSDDVVYAWLDTMTKLLDSNSWLKAMLLMIGGFALTFVMILFSIQLYDSASEWERYILFASPLTGVLTSVCGLWCFLTATRKPEHLLARWRKTWVDISGWKETVPLAADANGQAVPDSAKKPGLSLSQIHGDETPPPVRDSSVLKGIFIGGIPAAILVATIAAIMSANGYQFFKDKSGTPFGMAMFGGVLGAVVGALIGAIIQAISQKPPAVKDLTSRFEIKE
jgi:hypothetical protein